MSRRPSVQPMQFMTRAQARALPVAGYKVDGIIPNFGVGQVYGDSGCGKSFTLMTLCHCLSEGWQFCGRAVKRCAVYYFHLEGVGGLPKRLAAFDRWMEETGRSFDGQGRLFYRTADFSIDDADMASLAQTILDNGDEGAVVVIDTQAQATAGKDENSSQDMGVVLKKARSLAKAIRGVVLLVHHTGKNPALGGRGSSVQKADFDFQIEVSRDKANDRAIFWNSKKERDEDDKQKLKFLLKVYPDLVQDEDGKWQSSCVAVPADMLDGEEREAAETERPQKLPDSLVIALKALDNALWEERQKNPMASSVTQAQFRAAFYREKPDSDDDDDPTRARKRREKAFNRAINDLVAQSLAVHDSGFWSRCQPTVNGEPVTPDPKS